MRTTSSSSSSSSSSALQQPFNLFIVSTSACLFIFFLLFLIFTSTTWDHQNNQQKQDVGLRGTTTGNEGDNNTTTSNNNNITSSDYDDLLMCLEGEEEEAVEQSEEISTKTDDDDDDDDNDDGSRRQEEEQLYDLIMMEGGGAEQHIRSIKDGDVIDVHLLPTDIINLLVMVRNTNNSNSSSMTNTTKTDTNNITTTTTTTTTAAAEETRTVNMIESLYITYDNEHVRIDSTPPYLVFAKPKSFITMMNMNTNTNTNTNMTSFIDDPSNNYYYSQQHVINITGYTKNNGMGKIVGDITQSISFTLVRSAQQQPIPNRPMFIGEWIPIPDYPQKIGEAQGAVVGQRFLVSFGGYYPKFQTGPKETFVLDLKASSSSSSTLTTIDEEVELSTESSSLDQQHERNDSDWIQLVDYPIEPFVTHGAHAVDNVNFRFYICGGFLGAHPGNEINDCYVLKLKNDNEEKDVDGIDGTSLLLSSTATWTALPALPKGRGGGGMIYDEHENILVYTLGAIRPQPGVVSSIDMEDTWILRLNDDKIDNHKSNNNDINTNTTNITNTTTTTTTTWTWTWMNSTSKAPYLGNHVAAISVPGCSNNDNDNDNDNTTATMAHHYFLGGQRNENEQNGNIPYLYEYIVHNDTFIRRKDMPIGRGHFTTSITPYQCNGFIVIGGSIDGNNPVAYNSSDDIYYYNIQDDTWILIGKYPTLIKTPVCGIDDTNDYLYCTNGYTANGYRRKLISSYTPPQLTSGDEQNNDNNNNSTSTNITTNNTACRRHRHNRHRR